MYRIDILTLFDLTVGDVLSESILGRAQERDYLRIETHQIRDYTLSKQKQVDDYPYGGGRGAVMQADPLYQCWKHVVDTFGPGHTIYFSPAGATFKQADAKRLAADYDHLILVCGHYEGIDERFIEECVDEEISREILFSPAERFPPWRWQTQSVGWFRVSCPTRNALKTRATGTDCWNTPNIPVPRSGTGKRSPRFYCLETMPLSPAGEESRPFSGPRGDGPTCTQSWTSALLRRTKS